MSGESNDSTKVLEWCRGSRTAGLDSVCTNSGFSSILLDVELYETDLVLSEILVDA